MQSLARVMLKIYCMPIEFIIEFIIILFCSWFLLNFLFCFYNKQSIWRNINRILILPALFVIVYVTILKRQEGTTLEVVLMPFHSFVEAKENEEIYRSMLMNLFLFVPFGMTLVCSLPAKIKHCVVISVIVSMLLSISIESVQYFFQMGRVETDDVICNTLGGIIGVLTYLPVVILDKNIICKNLN